MSTHNRIKHLSRILRTWTARLSRRADPVGREEARVRVAEIRAELASLRSVR